jgi:hypothetical protein
MLTFRISATSGRIPVALFALELGVFYVAVLAAAYLGLFRPGDVAEVGR